MKQHIRELNADILGLCELDTLIKELELYKKANEIGRKAHLDIVGFLSDELEYDNFVLEKDCGIFASSIFWKRDRFECLQKGQVNLDYKMITPELAETLQKDGEDGDFSLMYVRLAPRIPNSDKVDLDKQMVICETHLKAMDDGVVPRIAQVKKIINTFKDKF